MRRISSVKGVEVYEEKGGSRAVFIRYQSDGKRHLERVPGEYKLNKGRCAILTRARRLLDLRREEIARARQRGEAWHSAREQRKEAKQAAVQVLDARAPLVFEAASTRFLDQEAETYSRPGDVRAVFSAEPGKNTGRPGALAEAFAGRYLDEITKAEVRQYFLDRMANTGPFAGRTRAVSRRAPEQEITLLSALYVFVQDEGHAIENPCHRPRTRRHDSPLATYKPEHEPVIASAPALRAMLSATLRAQVGPRSKNRTGAELISDEARALVALCYFTAARPESEPCRLTHGDVELGDGERWGSVTYRDTKTGGDRRVLLHPEAERYVKAALLPVPMDKAERERWAERPVFRKRGSAKPWGASSYRKAWANIVRAVAGEFPEVAGMWLRDLRKAAKTRMVDAGAPELAVNRILGHADGVAGRYYKLSDDAMQRALEALSLRAQTAQETAPSGVPERPVHHLAEARISGERA